MYIIFIIYLKITKVNKDKRLFVNYIKKEKNLQYRQYSQSFYFINRTEYLQGKEIFDGQIKLEDYIYVQKREYTKMSEVFSITGGYMQLISTVFLFINLFTKNLAVEKKILNKLFNFNLKQKKIVLNIQYEKKLNCFIRNEKGDINAFIPFIAKKGINTEKTLKFHINDNSPNHDYCLSTNNNSIINYKKRKKGTLKTNKKNE